ncbi:GAG-binding domain-containing protein [Streptococcus suis]|uniref:GAG-binding domain-containing protein n=1 Tax=Streptococcus suis TaxID=1307 RepID=UPI0003F720F8|nr:GAG-binding domain-containing protein [Streptococcus suis]ANC99169.1 YSIRK signal domain/LPXTG anchor domain surface protein [Streptococcus suis]AOM73889.1 YSIRK signal domain/LPXTG anchor domain surface protein [Streptococcus suis]MBS8058423.1 YSIRK-type signal peptide-containing protein [Streptococcus suis]MBS8113759.1 YSIRK-type signal peptide-containing protein [Streptococcus suis]MCL4908210.1 G5 domain-containing protein [Streptococcus suis]
METANKKFRYSIRKFKVGVGSVLLATCLLGAGVSTPTAFAMADPSPATEDTEVKKTPLQHLEELVEELKMDLEELKKFPEYDRSKYPLQKELWEENLRFGKNQMDLVSTLKEDNAGFSTIPQRLYDFRNHIKWERLTRQVDQYRKKYPDNARIEEEYKSHLEQTDGNNYASQEDVNLQASTNDAEQALERIQKIVQELEPKEEPAPVPKEEETPKTDTESPKDEKEIPAPTPDAPKAEEDAPAPKEEETPAPKEEPAPTPAPETPTDEPKMDEPKAEMPAPAPKEEEVPTPAPMPDAPKAEEEIPAPMPEAPAPTPEEPKTEEDAPTPAPAPETPMDEPKMEEPKSEMPAPAPKEEEIPAPMPDAPAPKEDEVPVPTPEAEAPKAEEEIPTPMPDAPAPTPEEPKTEEDAPTPAPAPETPMDQPKMEEPKAEDMPKEEMPKAEQPKAEDSAPKTAVPEVAPKTAEKPKLDFITKERKVEESHPIKEEIRYDASLALGKSYLLQEGKAGKKVSVYQDVIVDGKVVATNLLSETVVEGQNRILVKGSLEMKKEEVKITPSVQSNPTLSHKGAPSANKATLPATGEQRNNLSLVGLGLAGISLAVVATAINKKSKDQI